LNQLSGFHILIRDELASENAPGFGRFKIGSSRLMASNKFDIRKIARLSRLRPLVRLEKCISTSA
jgi:hypothetical protein